MGAAAITGMGAVDALGVSSDETWAALAAGENGIRELERYSTEGFSSSLGALVKDTSSLEEAPCLAIAFAVHAGKEALAQAGLTPQQKRIGLVLGTSLATARADLARIGEAVAKMLGLEGPCIVISTACSSSTHAVGLAKDLVLGGQCPVVLAGGTDELTPEIFAGFCALGVVSRGRCAPFSEPIGTSLGEGAGLVVVEAIEHAKQRGAPVLALVRGYGLSADAHHATSPDPAGAGVARALKAALLDAVLTAAQVVYVNAHGTGTGANDPAEARAIEATFGAERPPWVSSSKSFLGHAQGAAGILELIVTIMGMQRGQMPPTMSFTRPRPRCPADPVAGSKPRAFAFDTAMSTSSAFGGANASIVVTSPSVSVPAARPRRPVYVLGAALLGPSGITLADLSTARCRLEGKAATLDIARLIRGVDPRGLDTTTKLLAAVTKGSLDAAGISLRADARAKIGLFVGQTHVSAAADHEFHRSIEERTLAKLNATAFAKMVLNAAAGAVTRMLDLRGAMTAISTGGSSGTTAVALAADYLSSHEEIDLLVAAGVHELGDDDAPQAAEGGAALVLSTSPRAGCARIETWTIDAPSRTEDALDPSSIATGAGGFAGAAACAVASDRVMRGEVPRVTVADDCGTVRARVVFAREG